MRPRSPEERIGEQRNRDRIRLVAAISMVALVALSALPTMTAGAPVDEFNVLRFDATPNHINLGRESLIEVEIGSLRGGGTDTYLVYVTAPDGTETSTWMNFTAPGTKNTTLGDPDSGLMVPVDQVGTYHLRLIYYDGVNASLSGVEDVTVTDELEVLIETRIASNEYTDAHTCPISQDFQRGAEFVGIAWVYYASTGEAVTNEVPTTDDNITGTILGETKVLPWKSYASNWHQVWFFPWDAPVGAAEFSVEASDGMGNTGSAVTGMAWNNAINIGPAILTVEATILDDDGNEALVFEPGDNLTIQATGWYEDHNAHNKDFAGPLTPDRGGTIRAHLGWGGFNSSSGMFEEKLVNLTLTYDSDEKMYTTTYRIPVDSANISNVQALVLASDGADDPPNAGMTFTSMFAIQSPPPEPPAPPEPEEPEEEGFSGVVVGGLSAVALVAGLGVGMVVARRPKETNRRED